MQKLSHDNSVSLVTRLQVGQYRNGSLILSQGTRLSSRASRTTVWIIRLIHWLQGALSLGVHLLKCENEHSLPPCANVRIYGTEPPFPPCLHNNVLDEPQEQDYQYMLKWLWFKVISLRECVLWEQLVVQCTEIQTVFVHIEKLNYIHESLVLQSLRQICRNLSGRGLWVGGRGVQEPIRDPTKYSTNSSVFVMMEKWEQRGLSTLGLYTGSNILWHILWNAPSWGWPQYWSKHVAGALWT